jgi:hypothetical protein
MPSKFYPVEFRTKSPSFLLTDQDTLYLFFPLDDPEGGTFCLTQGEEVPPSRRKKIEAFMQAACERLEEIMQKSENKGIGTKETIVF